MFQPSQHGTCCTPAGQVECFRSGVYHSVCFTWLAREVLGIQPRAALGKAFADGRALIEDGLAVAVASDCNPGSCAFENLAMVLALACYGCRLSPAEAICATTHNAAVSLDLAQQVGRIEAGMSGDLLVLGSDDYRDLVYHAGSPLIDEVWSMGHRVA